MIQSAEIRLGWVPQLINKIQIVNLLFLSVTRLSNLCEKIRIITQFYITGEISF